MPSSLHPILRTVLQRLGLGLATLAFVSMLIFSAIEMLPGDFAKAILGQAATPETVAAFQREIGIDRPATTRYIEWLSNVAHGDFGSSFSARAGYKRSVAEIIEPRLYNTLFLAVMTALIAVPLTLFLGILTALYHDSWFDRVINSFTLVTISLPEFFVAYLLAYVIVSSYTFGSTQFAASLPIWLSETIESLLNVIPKFPILASVSDDMTFRERVWRCTLPTLTLTLVIIAYMMRMTRSAILNILASPYIEMARLKGLSPLRVILYHALPNALAPIATIIAFTLAYLIVGVVVVEVVFVYPGIGQLMVDAVKARDIPVVQACSLIFAGTYILLNLLADVLAIISNPRLLHPR